MLTTAKMLSRARDLLQDIVAGSQGVDDTRPSFMNLPVELRLRIYTFALCAPVHIAMHPMLHPSPTLSLPFFRKALPSTSSTLLSFRDRHERDSLKGLEEPGRFEGNQVRLYSVSRAISYCEHRSAFIARHALTSLISPAHTVGTTRKRSGL